jgi:hypothetical protein
MKTLYTLIVAVLISSCSRKTVPYFQNTKLYNNAIKNNQNDQKLAYTKNQTIQNESQNLASASISNINAFRLEALPKDKDVVALENKYNAKPAPPVKKTSKLKQIIAIKQAISKDKKPNYEKISKWALAMSVLSILATLLGLAIISFSGFGIGLFFASLILANIGLILGLIAVQNAEKKGRATIAIIFGIIWDILVASVLIR